MLSNSTVIMMEGSSISEKEVDSHNVGPQDRIELHPTWSNNYNNHFRSRHTPKAATTNGRHHCESLVLKSNFQMNNHNTRNSSGLHSSSNNCSHRKKRIRATTSFSTLSIMLLLQILAMTVLKDTTTCIIVEAANNNYNNNDDAQGDDYYNNKGDDYYDDDNRNNNNNDYPAYDDADYNKYNAADDAANLQDDDDYYMLNQESYVDLVEEGLIDLQDVTFMPISCIQYNNGHMVKFELFESANNYQCHFKNVGTYVVSIAHFMRAYFNQQALIKGDEFNLPGDAGYLNCVMLQQTAYSNEKLYAKIGCMDRETFTSTKLQLHVYTDKKCTERYQDGQSDRYHSSKGYEINGYTFSTRTTFRPPFYSCQTCVPYQISDTFMKKNYWYDDDYISQYGKKNKDYVDDENNGDDDGYQDDGGGNNTYYADDTTQTLDDKFYFSANDDGDDYNVVNNDDDFYKYVDDKNDDGGGKRRRRKRFLGRSLKTLVAASGELEKYAKTFWNDIGQMRRRLENDEGIGDWNFCERIHTYGIWCDSKCRAIDTFRVDEWSKSDIFLLVIMCLFMTAMMLLIFAKRVKANEKARIFDGEIEMQVPGLPPFVMALLFLIIISIILTLAKLKFVNETLVFAVVQCILLFIYMLKLTLFERQTPAQLLSLRRKPNSRLGTMNRHLFDS